MKLAVIPGRTRVLGAPAGWTPETSGECGALPIRDQMNGDVPAMLSAWRPDAAEIEALANGATITLSVLGTAHPPVSMFVDGVSGELGSEFEDSRTDAAPAPEVIALVIAAREALESEELSDSAALHKAVEAFASRVCYDDEGGTLPDAHADPCTCGGGVQRLAGGEGFAQADRDAVAWQRQHPVQGWIDCRLEDAEHYRQHGQAVRPLYAHPAPLPESAAPDEGVTQAEEWIPQIGEKVEVVGEYAVDWRGMDLWVAGVRVNDKGDGLDITISEQWPIPNRNYREYRGQTDGFSVEDLRSLATVEPKAAAPDAPDAGITSAQAALLAEEVVDSSPAINCFAACEWGELSSDGRVWITAIVQEAIARHRVSDGSEQ